MDEKELRELQDPNSWDDDSAELHPAVKNPRAVVSVSFAQDDLRKVSEFARAQGKKVSTFIREAALERATEADHADQSNRMTISTGHGGHVSKDFTSTGTVRAKVLEETRRRE